MDARSLLSTSYSAPLFGQMTTNPVKSDHSRTWFGRPATTTTMNVLPQLMSHPPITSSAFVPISAFAQSLSFASQMAFQQQQHLQQFGRFAEPSTMLRNFIFNHTQQAVLQKAVPEENMCHQDVVGLTDLMNTSSPGPASPMNSAPTFAPPKQNFASQIGQKRKSISVPDTDRKRNRILPCSLVDSEESESEKGSNKSQIHRGEKRLVILFECLGTKGKHPQTFGKSGAYIPDGICGSHTVYNERWRFEITHSTESFTVEKKVCVCLTWKITNLSTGATTTLTETKDEAILRNSQGQTISNKVFREALEDRARRLEMQLQGETNPKRIAHLESLIRGLRPKRFSEGPLVFGLQHKVVQDNLCAEVAS